MEVTLISSPKYTVDFAKYLPEGKKEESLTLVSRTYGIGVEIIKFFGVVISSSFHAGSLTLRYAVFSFVDLVLNSIGSTDFYFTAFKVAYWAFSLGFTFVATTVRSVIETYSSSNELYLAQFVKNGIDSTHIRTKGIQLDASGVPKKIKVGDLLPLFDAINFNDSKAPGYMPPTTREEEDGIYSIQELRESLETFVRNVKGRVPFLGTPPAHDRIRLYDFYQQIEDAVRLSLYKVTDDLEKFKNSHPDLTAFNEETFRTYKNLLEDQARLVIDLAIAGKHCGARYMGEAMSSYFNLYGKAKPSGMLEDTLIELLAAKRNEVAQAEIQRYFKASAHGFSQYMEHLGALLAIPGTENVVEHLSGAFDYTRYLRSFFQIYTEDFIINAIQEKIKKSQTFREQIIDWFKEQVGKDWIPEDLPAQEEIIKKLEKSKGKSADVYEAYNKVGFFISCLELKKQEVHVMNKAAPFPNLDSGWSEFVQQVFALDEVKNIFNRSYPSLSLMDRMRRRHATIQKLSKGSLGKALEKQYFETESIVIDEPLIQLITDVEIAESMNEVLSIDVEVLLRSLQGKAQIAEIVQGYLQDSLQSKFLCALNIESMERDGLSPILLEWLLDAHHIFVPEDLDHQKPSSNLIDPYQAELYKSLIMQQGNSSQILREKYTSARGKRYIFGAKTDDQEVAFSIFEKAFKQNADIIVQKAESILSNGHPFYPNWKTAIYIKAPEVGAAIFGNTLLKVAISAIVAYKIFLLTRKAYKQSTMWANRFYHYMTKEAHPQVIKAYQNVCKVHQWLTQNKWKVFLSALLLRLFLPMISHPLAQRVAKFIDPRFIIDRDNYGLLEIILTPVPVTWKASSKMSFILQYAADRAKDERLSFQKKHCYFLWNQVLTL